MKTVLRTFSAAEADLAWSRLDAAGIPASLVHDQAALWTDCYSVGTGGILVQVPDPYEADARGLLTPPTSTAS